MKLNNIIQGLQKIHDAVENGMAGDDTAIEYLRVVLSQLVAQAQAGMILDMAIHLYERSLDYAEKVAESN